MPLHRVTAPAAVVPLDFDAIRAELGVPGPFPAEVLAEAERSVADAVFPELDATDLPLVTVDPPGARDLDQAVAIERRGDGWRVHYAIADVGTFVAPGGAVDTEARLRTQTHYAPDANVPLHPPIVSEQAASLLAGEDRPAVLWSIEVGADGSTGGVDVRKAIVRSRTQLTYTEVQAMIDRGAAPDALAELPALGAALLADARRRDAIDLGLPEQEVVPDGDGHWTIGLRADLAVETWNAQISLLTGRAAAKIMLEGGVGILRTLPRPDPDRFPRMRAAAESLGIDWAEGEHPGAVLARLDTSLPRHAAFADLSAELLRGAGYTGFQGAAPDDPGHAGVGDTYAHVTAPLRRLVDRFTSEICVHLAAGTPVPEWLVESVESVPAAMAAGDQRARALDRAVIDAAEAFVLAGRVGEVFRAAVIETGPEYGTVVIDEPMVIGRCESPDLPLGRRVDVRCIEADVVRRRVRFARIG